MVALKEATAATAIVVVVVATMVVVVVVVVGGDGNGGGGNGGRGDDVGRGVFVAGDGGGAGGLRRRVVCGEVEMILPLEGLIDFATERARLQKDMEKQQAEAAKIEGLLGRESFVERAPAEVLETNRSRLSELKEQLGKMQALLNGPYAVNS
jgi:hypothetical protein